MQPADITLRHYIDLIEHAEKVGLMPISEAQPAFDPTLRLYHGTSTLAAATGILQHGLLPAQPSRYRGSLRPVDGRVYVTASLPRALSHAFGKWWKRTAAREPFGFMFVIPADRLLADVQPDEDSIASFLQDHAAQPGQKSVETIRDYVFRPTDAPDQGHRQTIWEFIAALASPYDLEQTITFDDPPTNARLGKRAVAKMPDWMKLKLIEWGANVAYAGPLRPTECWRIAKRYAEVINAKKADFYQLAERMA